MDFCCVNETFFFFLARCECFIWDVRCNSNSPSLNRCHSMIYWIFWFGGKKEKKTSKSSSSIVFVVLWFCSPFLFSFETVFFKCLCFDWVRFFFFAFVTNPSVFVFIFIFLLLEDSSSKMKVFIRNCINAFCWMIANVSTRKRIRKPAKKEFWSCKKKLHLSSKKKIPKFFLNLSLSLSFSGDRCHSWRNRNPIEVEVERKRTR